MYFSETCAILLKQYLSIHPADNDALFLNRFGNRLSSEGIYRVTTKLGGMMSRLAHFFPHRFRHTFASNIVRKGAELDVNSSVSKHANLSATMIYARLPIEEHLSLYRKYCAFQTDKQSTPERE